MPRAGLTPSLVTSAAVEIADESGLDAVTISAVARRVNVRPASLYSHVGGTDDLLRRVTLAALAELADLVGEAVSGRSGRDALAAMAVAYRDYAVASPARYAAARRRVDHATAMSSAGPRLGEMTAAVLRGYAVPEADRVDAVRIVSSAIHGFLDLEGSGAFDHSEPPPAATWERLVESLDALLQHWS